MPPVILALFVVIALAKLLSDGEWTLEAKFAVGVLAFSVIAGLLMATTAWVYGAIKRRKKP